MSARRVLFIDRDGTLIEEPPDEQIDSIAKVRLVAGVIPALLRLRDAGFELVIVSNQDGLGTASFPEPSFREPQEFMMRLFESQGILFAAAFFCPHFPKDGCSCRKPKTGLLDEYLRSTPLDKSASYVIGDRHTDLDLATALGVTGFQLKGNRGGTETWESIADRLTKAERRGTIQRK